jgi:hypothetical protein
MLEAAQQRFHALMDLGENIIDVPPPSHRYVAGHRPEEGGRDAGCRSEGRDHEPETGEGQEGEAESDEPRDLDRLKEIRDLGDVIAKRLKVARLHGVAEFVLPECGRSEVHREARLQFELHLRRVRDGEAQPQHFVLRASVVVDGSGQFHFLDNRADKGQFTTRLPDVVLPLDPN